MAMSDITLVLSAIEAGDPHADAQLLPLVCEELRKLAAQKLAQQKPGQTLEATALVHEAYVRLVNASRVDYWDSRGHFFAAVAEAMGRILIEQARRKRRRKHGALIDRRRAELEQEVLLPGERFFQDSPRELTRRLKGYWKSWRGPASPTQANESLLAPT
jgi:RNA polymerase sigma factor (TIGR02999 family)